MPLALIVDNIESVPEAIRSEYTEKDGKYHLNVEGLEDTSGLKTALNSERQLRAKYEKLVKGWEKTGKTPEEIEALLEDQRKKEEDAAKKAGDFDSILKQHQDKFATREKELLDEVNAARASERNAVIETSLLGALTKAGVTEEGAELLPERLANRIKFETVNGKRLLKIMQVDGETPMAGSGADGTATIDDLVKEASAKYLSLFKSNNAGGGGKVPDVKNPGGSGVTKKSDFKSEKDRAAYFEKYGKAAYDALPD